MLCLAFALLLSAAAEPPAAVPGGRLLVHVEVERSATNRDADVRILADLEREAREIWRPYADLEFTSTRLAKVELGMDAVTQVHLAIVDHPLPPRGRDATGLGSIEFVSGHPVDRITVSSFAAREIAEKSWWVGRSLRDLPGRVVEQFVARALGRAFAHELGHYLLASATHTPHGLMRRQFDTDEFVDHNRTRYRLEPAQVEVLRRLMPRRAQVAPDPTSGGPGIG